MLRAALLLPLTCALRAPARQVRRFANADGLTEAGTPLNYADESPFLSSPQQTVTSTGDGLHGEKSCFLPLDQLDNGEPWPRIIRVAGVYPGLTQAEVAACTSAPAPPEQDGMWLFDFPDVHGAEFGVVAMPGSDIISGAIDPVAIVASSASLGLLIDDKECLCLIDRGEVDFSDRHFFCFAEMNGNTAIRRMDGLDGETPAGWSVLGRVVVVTLPWDMDTMAKKGTWMEED